MEAEKQAGAHFDPRPPSLEFDDERASNVVVYNARGVDAIRRCARMMSHRAFAAAVADEAPAEVARCEEARDEEERDADDAKNDDVHIGA